MKDEALRSVLVATGVVSDCDDYLFSRPSRIQQEIDAIARYLGITFVGVPESIVAKPVSDAKQHGEKTSD